MNDRLQILLIEDAAPDAQLIAHQLKQSGFVFQITQVTTESELRHELATRTPDLILSDHGLPSFSGFDALEIVRRELPSLPFIFVSGSNAPNLVAQMYEAGATDYVFKQDLEDLKAAVLQALGLDPTVRHSPTEFHEEPAWARSDSQFEAAVVESSDATEVTGRVTYCPHCHKMFDETGRSVEMGTYCSSHAEIVVTQQTCESCCR